MKKRSSATSILLGHLNSNGDCLFATTVAHQIKKDFPGCKLTWAIGSNMKGIVSNNQDVDEIWEIPLYTITQDTVETCWKLFLEQAEMRKLNGDFDHIFLTQFSYGHFDNYMGITRASIFEGYPLKIDYPVHSWLSLTAVEIGNVQRFLADIGHQNYKKVFVFECAALSGQSFISEIFVKQFTQLFEVKFPDACLILSSKDIVITGKNIFCANSLTFRENAELLNHCDGFIGCSSGITWLSTCEMVRNYPKILLINENAPQASMVLDHLYFGIDDKDIIELTQCTPEQLIEILANPGKKIGLVEQLKAKFSYETTCFVNPFEHHFKRKNFQTAKRIFFKANFLAKRQIFSRLLRHYFSHS